MCSVWLCWKLSKMKIQARYFKLVENGLRRLQFPCITLTQWNGSVLVSTMYPEGTSGSVNFIVSMQQLDKHSIKESFCTAQEIKFSINNFFSKCDQIRRKLRIWSHLLKKSLMGNFIFYAVLVGLDQASPDILDFVRICKINLEAVTLIYGCIGN